MNITATANDDGTVDLVGKQGKTWTFSVTAYQDTEKTIPLSLVGKSARGQIRKTHSASKAAATFACTILTPANGTIDILLDAAQSEDIKAGELVTDDLSQYVYDIEIYSGTPEVVDYIIGGKLSIEPEVTK